MKNRFLGSSLCDDSTDADKNRNKKVEQQIQNLAPHYFLRLIRLRFMLINIVSFRVAEFLSLFLFIIIIRQTLV